MLRLKIINPCKKDLKKFKHKQSIIDELDNVIKTILTRKELDPKYCDHPLSGNWKGSRECHVKPDALLIYRIEEKQNVLILERFGSHPELFQ